MVLLKKTPLKSITKVLAHSISIDLNLSKNIFSGNKYANFYNYPQCNNWIDKEIRDLERSSDSDDKKYLSRVKIMKKTCEKEGKISPPRTFVRSGGFS